MSDIQVNEYVRTKDGYIAKVIETWDYGDIASSYDLDTKVYFDGDYSEYSIDEDIIVKHSFNIIDLIEEGDYVNGDKIVAIDYTEDENGNYINVLGINEIEDDFAYPIELRVINIKSIVTKERMKESEYIV